MIPFVSRASAAEQAIWLKHLSDALPNESILPFSSLTSLQKQDCDIAIVANPDPADLLSLPALKWVHSVWAGVERIVNEIASPPFAIVRLIDPNLSRTMSEAVLAWTLFLHRDMPTYAQQQAKQSWQPLPMVQSHERRIGVLGLGELGRVSAQRLKDNGFTVAGWSRTPKQLDGMACFYGEDGLLSLLAQSDILVCLLPLTAETDSLLDQARLSCLPTGASVINFARGAIIDDNALLTLLDNGHLSHAVLDVFRAEPLSAGHPFWQHKSVTVLPHISAPTHPVSASRIVAANIDRFRITNEIPSAVDPIRGY